MSYIEVGHFEASGASVALTWDNERNPDFLMAWNQTKFATDATNVFLLWEKDYAAGDASIIINDTTDGMKGVVETTNGITQNDSVAYSDTANLTRATHTLNLTLGSAFYGADSDEISYIAIWADKFNDRGDINA
jgi:hypothetical protein